MPEAAAAWPRCNCRRMHASFGFGLAARGLEPEARSALLGGCRLFGCGPGEQCPSSVQEGPWLLVAYEYEYFCGFCGFFHVRRKSFPLRAGVLR